MAIPTTKPDVTPTDHGRNDHDAAGALWTELCADLAAPWLAEIGALPCPGDDLESALDIWSLALVSALRDPARAEVARKILGRLVAREEQAADHPGA